MNRTNITYLGDTGLAGCGCGCGGCNGPTGLSDVITSDFATVNILERFPKKGPPPPGAPFSIKVEVQTYRSGGNFWRTPFACLDAFVVARGLYQHRGNILASSFVRTDAFRGCRGEATLSFDPSFRAGETDWVQLEVYKGGTQELFANRTTLQMVNEGRVELMGQSEPMRFNASQKELYNAGVITDPESLLEAFQNPLFGNLRSTIGSVTTLLAVAAGGYLVWKNGDAIRAFVSKKIPTGTTKQKRQRS